jgi:hypothetical protein
MTLAVGKEANTRANKIANTVAFAKIDILDIATSFMLHAVEQNSNFRIARKRQSVLKNL